MVDVWKCRYEYIDSFPVMEKIPHAEVNSWDMYWVAALDYAELEAKYAILRGQIRKAAEGLGETQEDEG